MSCFQFLKKKLVSFKYLFLTKTRKKRYIKIETFDIFDTCLSRKHSFPEDLFLELAEKLILDQPIPLSCFTPNYITFVRLYAQKIAYSSSSIKDPSLLDIYYEIKKIIPNLNIDKAIKIEKELESNTIVPCLETLELVKKAREKYGKVIFISDMYLPKDFLIAQLEKYGFWNDYDKIYISNEIKLNKTSGKLYERVAYYEKYDLKNILHHGDNLSSDIRKALKIGLNTKHIRYCFLNKRELNLHKTLSTISPKYASRISGSGRATRISKDNSKKNLIDDFIVYFIGPTLWIYAEWILQKCIKDKKKFIYLSSRDCLGLFWILQKIIKSKGLEINLVYFQVSRSSLTRASIYKNGKINLKYLKRYFFGKKVKDLFSFLNVNKSEYIKNCQYFKQNQINCESILGHDYIWKMIEEGLNTYPFLSRIIQDLKLEKNAANEYFKNIGLHKNKNLFVVDLVVNLNCSEILIELLSDIRIADEIKFLFLGIGHKPAFKNLKINFEALFYPLDPSFRLNKYIKRTLLRELLLSCDGSDPLKSYLDLNKRYCDISNINKNEELYFRKQCGTSIYIYAENFVFSINENESDLKALIYKVNENFFKVPEKKWLKLLENIETTNQSFEDSYLPIARKYGLSIKKFIFFCESRNKLEWLENCGKRQWRELALVNSSNVETISSFFFKLLIKLLIRINKKIIKTKYLNFYKKK